MILIAINNNNNNDNNNCSSEYLFLAKRNKIIAFISHSFKTRESKRNYSTVPNNRGGGGLNKKGSPTDNLNINKRGVQIKGRASEKCSLSKVATRYY